MKKIDIQDDTGSGDPVVTPTPTPTPIPTPTPVAVPADHFMRNGVLIVIAIVVIVILTTL